ncbi:MAG TPA: hypothetical protein VFV05_11330 [Methylomirabilota bacterium]|nr:hypothetical protein [Methylomirabilota bacterium]
MMSGLHALSRTVPITCLAMVIMALVWATPVAANEVVQWNETTMKAIAANGQSPVVATRTLAMVHTAVHDAGAAAVVLAGVLGGDQANFSFKSGKPFEGITRSFTSFSQAARESADSRVYAGIHFRSACEDGLALGRKVGQRVAKLYLQPARK